MGSLDFGKLPQQPFYLEDKRSPEEKAANAKLLNEERIVVIIKRVAVGIVIGFVIGFFVGMYFQSKI